MDLRISELFAMQQALWEKNKDRWEPMEPIEGRNSILWMMEEIGEVISIIKKRGEAQIMADKALRRAFVEEMVDVSMYFCDALIRYGVTAEEFSNAYDAKHLRNMGRDFQKEHERYLQADE